MIPILAEKRNHSGIAPSVEVKRAENQDVTDVEDLTSNDEEKPNQPKPKSPSESVAPKPQPEDTQMKKAIELLRDKPAAPAQRAA